jgi:cysteine-rich repeat protein
MRARILTLVVTGGLLATGCLEKQALVPCGESFCVGNTTCVAERCVTQEALAACSGLGEGDACVIVGATGRCEGGVCVGAGCGNSVVDLGEVCDDGNVASGDGCRADCQKIEMCGDAELDQNEGCDDANTNPADGCDACMLTEWQATAEIGSDSMGTSYALGNPSDVAVDLDGIAFIADPLDARIVRLHPNGTQSLVAGIGTSGFSGDGGLATNARLNAPQGVALDALGNIYIADSSNARIRKIDHDGVISTFAGTGLGTYSGDNGPALAAGLNRPIGLAVDGLGNLYIAEVNSNRIRKVDTAGIITTYAGDGTSGSPGPRGDGGPATSAQLNSIRGIAVDAPGNLYIASGNRIRKVDTLGMISTIAGTDTAGSTGDGGQAASALLSAPYRIAVDPDGRLYITENNSNRVRRIDVGGEISTFAGALTAGFSGDGGAATSALLRAPDGIAVDRVGNVLIVDTNNQRLRRVNAAGTISTVAGTGETGFTSNGSSALSAPLLATSDVTFDSVGNLYFAESSTHRIRRVDAITGVITTIAGTGVLGTSGDGGPALMAQLTNPTGVLRVGTDLYISDSVAMTVRKIDANGVITRVAGTVLTVGNADNVDALQATFNGPSGLAFKGGELYIADTGNHRIRKLTAAGALTTIAGTTAGINDCSAGVAATAKLNTPTALAFDGSGNLLIADTNNYCIRTIDGAGDISTVAGTGTAGFSGDLGAATAAELRNPRGLAVASNGDVYFADTGNTRVRKISGGTITTVAGDGVAGFSGDGGPSTSARIDTPLGLGIDGDDRVYFSDTQIGTAAVRVIRKIETSGTITTVAGLVDPIGAGPLSTATLASPVALVRDAAFTIFAGGTRGIVQILRPGAAAIETVAGRYPQSLPAAYSPTPAVGNLARWQGSAFGSVDGVAYDAATKRIYISQASTSSILEITTSDAVKDWTIATLANTAGVAGYADGAIATARFRAPTGLYLDGSTLYVADTGNHVLRAIDLSTSTVSTVAGTPFVRGYFGDGVPAAVALLQEPRAVTRCPNGELFIADTGNHRVRRVSGGMITTVLGDGNPASSGEGGPASTFPVDTPLGLVCDASGNLFVTSTTTVRLLPADPAGVVDGTGTVQTIFALPPRETFPASAAACLTGIVTVDATTVQVADACSGLLIRLERKPAI